MNVIPAIRTPPTADSREQYAKYLKTPRWKATRNAALARAHWTCERCPAKRGLQVHHKTYDRLGHEHSLDLEVLCRDCHEGHHIEAMHGNEIGRIYLKLAREVLRNRAFDSFSDLVAEMKAQCAKLKLPYNEHQVDTALGLLSGSTKFSTPIPQTQDAVEAEQHRPLTEAEARECLKRLGVDAIMMKRMVKPMPAVELVPTRILDAQKAMSFIEAEMVASLKRCADWEEKVS